MLLDSWMGSLSNLSVQVNISLRTLSIVGMTVTQQSTMYFAYGPDGKVFFCALNYPGSWADSSSTAQFLHHTKKRIGNFKICVDKGFPRSGSYCTKTSSPYA